MKKLIFFFIALLAAIWIGMIMHKNPGFVIVNFGHTRIEMTVWVAILTFIILFIVLNVVFAFVRGIFSLPGLFTHWSDNRNEINAQQHMEAAFFSMLEGDHKKAEKDFIQSAKSGKTKLLNYLGAARSAQVLQQTERRDKYLAKAKKVAVGEQVNTVDMVKVRWQVESEQWGLALATLKSLSADSLFALRMKKKIYVAQKNWEALKKMLPQIKSHGLFKDEEAEKLKHDVLFVLMEEARAEKNHAEIEMLWQDLPKKLKSDPELLSVYAEHLIDEGKHSVAETLLFNELKHKLHPGLLTEYCRVISPKPARQLSRAEAWLDAHPEDADLLFCLGKICQQHRLWGKAKTYFQSSITIRPSKKTYQVLGDVLESLDEDAAALACYREGLLQQ
jgi:HemY protein